LAAIADGVAPDAAGDGAASPGANRIGAWDGAVDAGVCWASVRVGGEHRFENLCGAEGTSLPENRFGFSR